MTSRDFCFWLQGYLEINYANKNNYQSLTAEQIETVVGRHLSLVFAHEIDPSMGDKKEQNVLNKIHHNNRPKDALEKITKGEFE